MKEIISVKADDDKYNIKIEGENIDLYTVIAEIVREISKQRNVSIDTSLKIIEKMLEVESENKM